MIQFHVLITESKGRRTEDLYRVFPTFDEAAAWVVSIRGMLSAKATVAMVLPVRGWRRLFRGVWVPWMLRAVRMGNVWDWDEQWTPHP